MNNQIFLYKRGSIAGEDLLALKSAGYLPIACASLDDVVLLFPNGDKLKGDAVLQAALHAISGDHSGTERQKFGTAIMRWLMPKPKPTESK